VSGYFGKIRKLRLLVDGVDVGEIGDGETVEIDVPEYGEMIYGKMDWGKTVQIPLRSVADTDTITFEPYSTINLFRQLGILPIPIRVTIG